MAGALYDSVAHHEKLLAHKDFIPQVVNKKEYDTLEDMISKANKWLESHPEYSVQTCETYNIKVHKKGADPDHMAYMRKGQDEDSFTLAARNYYLRCLRIWLIPHVSSSNTAQIGVKTFTPRAKKEYTVDSSRFESLDETVKLVNDSFRMNAVEGKFDLRFFIFYT